MLAVLLFAPISFLGGSVIGDSLDLRLLKLQYRIREPLPPPKDIVLVSIDEASFEHFGLSTLEPWPRELFAEFLEKLSAFQPKLVVLDYQFPKISDPRRADQARDERLAHVFALNPTVLAKFLDPRRNENLSAAELQFQDSDELFLKNVKGEYFANLSEAAGEIWFFNTGLGTEDGIPPIVKLVLDGNITPEDIPAPNDMINYFGPPGWISHVSFSRVLSAEAPPLPPDFFKDKIVFVGQQLFVGHEVFARDTFSTPVSKEYMAGGGGDAAMGANVLQRVWIKRLPIFNEMIVILVFTTFFSYLIFSVRPSKGAGIAAVLLAAWFPVSYALFLRSLFFPGLLVVLCVGCIAYPVAMLRYYYEKQAAERALGIYVDVKRSIESKTERLVAAPGWNKYDAVVWVSTASAVSTSRMG